MGIPFSISFIASKDGGEGMRSNTLFICVCVYYIIYHMIYLVGRRWISFALLNETLCFLGL